MGKRRKPLVLASTKSILNSLNLNSSRQLSENNFILSRAGILCFKQHHNHNLDDASLVGLSLSALKTLSVTSGSLVLVKNVSNNIQRIGQVIVLDPPNDNTNDDRNRNRTNTMLMFPTYSFNDNHSLNCEVAYLSPTLAFNLDLHTLCLQLLVKKENNAVASLFDDYDDHDDIEGSAICLRLEPFTQPKKYAAHLTVSTVKIPQCGTLEFLIGKSSCKSKEREEFVDKAIYSYFEVDRFMSRGDVFTISLDWSCNSYTCVSCSQRSEIKGDSNIIYFKVEAIEPSDELVLRVNQSQTRFVLGANAPSAIPPNLLISGSKILKPVQGDTVKNLACVLAPALIPDDHSSRYRVAVLLQGSAVDNSVGCGKRTVVKYVACQLGLHVVEYSCHSITRFEKETSAALTEAFNTAKSYSPVILLLRHFDIFRKSASPEDSPGEQVSHKSKVAKVIKAFTQPLSDDEEDSSNYFGSRRSTKHKVLLVAAVDSAEGLAPPIRQCFEHELSMGPFTEEQRTQILSHLLQAVSEIPSKDLSEDFIKDMVGQTSGFMPRDLRALVAELDTSSSNNTQINKIELDKAEDSVTSKSVPHDTWKENLDKAMLQIKKMNASALGTPKVPNVKWEDVGGLEDVKKSILETIQVKFLLDIKPALIKVSLPLLHKELFSSGLRKRSGVLFYGPPGTGKTLLAKAVATECSLNFLSVKGPELINMYIGESEKNVRDIFQKARLARPCVIFFDELDSLAPARGASGDSGGVMDRVVSQMLAEIDGLSDSSQDLFIIGATNRPDLIDPALLRPGRFDKLLYVGVNSEASYRERVLKALTRKFKLDEDVSLLAVAKKCPPNITGADMYALCAGAWFQASKRKVLRSDYRSSGTGHDETVISYNDFMEGLRDLTPSISMAELKKYETLRDQFEDSQGLPSKTYLREDGRKHRRSRTLRKFWKSLFTCFSESVKQCKWKLVKSLVGFGGFLMLLIWDERKRLGLGFGGGEVVDMEETELEEGEACSFSKRNHHDATVDPDVALSYIGEKLEHVLGHFQKDFEGEVLSAENLGAKYGGYGSFLPTYQRSPILPHPQTPQKVQNGNITCSPSGPQLEGSHRDSRVLSKGSQSVRVGSSTSGNTKPLPASKGHSIKGLVKKDAPKQSANKKACKLSDQKTLKFRFKVGPDSLSTQKNAAIYSGLGLDDSPSSSVEGSPSGSEHDRPFESPFAIVQIMTSSHLHNSPMLSPLSDFFTYLSEKEKIPNSITPSLARGTEFPRSVRLTAVSRTKSEEKDDFSVESRNKLAQNSVGITSTPKDEEIDALVCDEFVANTLKLPLLAHSYSAVGDIAKGNGKSHNGEAYDSVVRDKVRKEELLEPKAEIRDKKKSSKHEKGTDSYVSKGRKTPDTEIMNNKAKKRVNNKKSLSLEKQGTSVKEHSSSSGGKRKSKGSDSSTVDIPKEVPKNEKSIDLDYHMKDEFKMEKDMAKSEDDRYKEFFGDFDESEKKETPFNVRAENNRLNNSEVAGKGTSSLVSNAVKEKSQSEKINKTTSQSEKSNVSRHPGNEPFFNTAPVTGTSNDNWVACDKCQQWRLLPAGVNPDVLPEKWLCSMLYWLPGMNHCRFSEDETTKALNVSSQVTVQDGQNNLNGGSSGIKSANFRNPDLNNHSASLPSIPDDGKKKHGSKEISNAVPKDVPVNFSNSIKNMQSSSGGRMGNFNDVSHSPLVGDPDNWQSSNSADLLTERHVQKQKEKYVGHTPDRGDVMNSKVKSKRGPEEESFRADKKIKIKDSPFKDEGWTSDRSGKVGPSLSSGLPSTSAGKDRSKYNDRSSSKDSKNNSNDKMHVSAKKLKDKVQVSLDEVSNSENRNLAKKRKLKESQEAENAHRREKKARRGSMSEGKECSASKGSDKADNKRGSHSKDRPVKKDPSFVQPIVVAATSSSSKVSGSHKSKARLHESKGSPVGSVSSSPLRVSNKDKMTSARRDLNEKQDSHDLAHYESSILDLQDKKSTHFPGNKSKAQVLPSVNITNGGENSSGKDSEHPSKQASLSLRHDEDQVLPSVNIPSGVENSVGKDRQRPSKRTTSKLRHDEEKQNDSFNQDSHSTKLGKNSFIPSKDNISNLKSESEPGKIKTIDSSTELQIRGPRDSKNKSLEKVEVKSNEIDKRKESSAKVSGESSQRRTDVSSLKADASFGQQECNGEKSSKKNLPIKSDLKGPTIPISAPLPPFAPQNETLARCPRPVSSGAHKVSGVSANNSSEGKHNKKGDEQNGTTQQRQNITPPSNRIRVADKNKDSSNQSANSVMKEATDLKHRADKFKNTGLIQESTDMYFQAALKFLHAASLLESICGENAKQEDLIQTIKTYSSTANLCDFCAREFEKSKDMASAALAYKCREVAFMRVVYNSHSSASRDRQELQTALQIVPPGESPSSSASDVDNLIHPTSVDKACLPKGVSSPQVSGHQVIAPRNRPNLSEVVHFAMEASKKSRMALATANLNLGESHKGISATKTALDFNFHDVGGLLRLVRLAMEKIV
ncbi:hypothetical protein ACFE04_020388 [Oxalis oulophora]